MALNGGGASKGDPMRYALVLAAFMGCAGLSYSYQTESAGVRKTEEAQADPFAIERRIIQYLQSNMEPGRPVILSNLYNEVFTEPEERAALDRLNRAFFRLPSFLVDYQAQQGRLPTLEEIAGQFDFYGAEQADVMLAVMESDPRVPVFFSRDPDTGELLELDMDRIRNDPRFGSVVERSLVWEGRVIPDVGGPGFGGSEVSVATTEAEAILLYVWFTYCPPCVRMAPELVALQERYEDRGFTVLGANADRTLELTYTDDDRAEYVEDHSINFPNFHLSAEDRAALGNVNIFPTMFLMGADRIVVKYYVNYQAGEVLEADIESVLDTSAVRSD